MFDINPRACMQTPRIADFAEFSFHARNFGEGVPGIRQAKVTKQAVKDAPERVCIHALVSDGGESVGQHAIKRKSRLIYGERDILREIERFLRLKFEKSGFIEI
ncbi:hypothetical protein [Cohnella phaseoli]|uniref:Uncharacterized protein n=1 Tax=Cohnella phaseoli TaxID=456490 RepID=A0A3D9ITT7_9BACL|nr:hypothetical protein [Cohnella phaseoli]RED65154.1 hypothetical protein DFP98_12145 [Cohnella phaseoli]